MLACLGLSLAAHGAAMLTLERIGVGAPRPRLIDTVGVPTTFAAPVARDQPPPAPSEPPPAAEAPPIADPASQPAPVAELAPIVAAPLPRAEPARPALRPAPTVPAPAGDPPPTTASFAGVEGVRARRVVYVVDGSGPMTSCLPFVKAELERSVARLTPEQTFQVIVTRRRATEPTGEVLAFRAAGGGFSAHDDAASVALREWLGAVQPRWASDPMSGLEAAVAEHPDLIFLLTRSIRRSASGDARAAADAALARLDQLNPRGAAGQRPVVIKVIQFLEEDPSGLLPRIAEAHGDGPGSYRVLGVGELR
ncbi:MAG: hypothetical protein ACOYN0_08720 [Phycisphaerales bacterium]